MPITSGLSAITFTIESLFLNASSVFANSALYLFNELSATPLLNS